MLAHLQPRREDVGAAAVCAGKQFCNAPTIIRACRHHRRSVLPSICFKFFYTTAQSLLNSMRAGVERADVKQLYWNEVLQLPSVGAGKQNVVKINGARSVSNVIPNRHTHTHIQFRIRFIARAVGPIAIEAGWLSSLLCVCVIVHLRWLVMGSH